MARRGRAYHAYDGSVLPDLYRHTASCDGTNPCLLVSIQVGKPTVHGQKDAADPLDRPWRTGFFKEPVCGPVWVGRTNVTGDGQANGRVHGGPDKAVLAYAERHYAEWRVELGLPDLPYGAFAENFTVRGLDEQSVCVGDIYRVGEARVQVSQPRQPCVNIAHRWRIPTLTQQVETSGRTGWYLRVLEEGLIEAGQAIELLDRPSPEWSVARATSVMRERQAAPDAAAALAALSGLSAVWRRTLASAARA
jgi:MOSC domain-containing protein YiiM